jgi:3-keto-5-aminohexanoate cleavage enzyme
MDKRFVSVAPVGYGQESVPSPREIADIVYRCWNEGAAIVHLHPVDVSGNITSNISLFEQTVTMIREKCDIIIQGSTGGVSTLAIEDRSLSVGVPHVEQGSLNMGSTNLFGSVFANIEEDIRYIARKMIKYGVKAELEIFNEPMIDFALEIREEGLLLDPLLFQLLVIEKEGSDPSERKTGKLSQKQKRIMTVLESIPTDAEVSLCVHGRKDFSLLALALSLGLNIRVGFEDSKHIAHNRLAKDNAELVEEAVRIMKSLGLQPSSASEARKRMKMK